jgi:hypothetical protein
MRRTSPYGPNPARIATIFLLIAIVIVVIWFASSNSENSFYEKIIAPLFGTNNMTATPNPSTSPSISPKTTSPNVTGSSASTTKRLEFKPFVMYGVQLGAFSVRENAAATANIINTMGAAGYIYEDKDLYRVLATVFYDENDARGVVDNIKASSDMDACLKIITIDGLTLDISASSDQVEMVRNAHNVWLDSAKKLAQIDRSFDSTLITRAEFTTALNELVTKIATARKDLEKHDTSSTIIKSLCTNLTKQEGNISALATSTLSDKELTSKTKYTLIDMVLGFSNYAKSVG